MERFDLKVGTKSILFGVHAFWFHPLTVWCSWVALYGKFPKWHENVAIFCHDLGYWGCPNMDGEEGQRHPVRGADLAERVVREICWAWVSLRYPIRAHCDESFKLDMWTRGFELAAETHRLALGHSRFYAKKVGIPVSPLFKADKACIYFDPIWLYLLRAHASGEIWEYKANAGTRLPEGATTVDWFRWYYKKVGELL